MRKALEVKEWLNDVADVLAAAEVPFTWQHPLTGFPLRMRYQKGDRQKGTPTPSKPRSGESKSRTPKHIYFTVFPHDAKLLITILLGLRRKGDPG